MEPLREGSELATVYRLVAAAESRIGGESHAHTLRVGRSAGLLATEIGLPARQVELIRFAAPLHDVGKLGISDALLCKPGPLDSLEQEEVRRHVEIGRAILDGSDSEVLRTAAEIAFTHHEWWDGRGYPRELEEEQIPLAGRITAIADAFDAMTHGRPYKPAWSTEEALTELHLSAGTQFDPWLVEAFEALDHPDLLRLTEEPAPLAAPAAGEPVLSP